MRRLIGYTLFWLAAGMAVQLLFESILLSTILILTLMLIGYNLFFC